MGLTLVPEADIPGRQWAITACRRWPECRNRTPDAVRSRAALVHPEVFGPALVTAAIDQQD